MPETNAIKKSETGKRYTLTGSIRPQIWWPHLAANEMALYGRELTGAMLYAHVLALYLLQRHGDAITALTKAQKRSPRIAKMLTAREPGMPELKPGLITLGGEDEAWYYRQNWLEVWESTGALAWLRQAAGVKA